MGQVGQPGDAVVTQVEGGEGGEVVQTLEVINSLHDDLTLL